MRIAQISDFHITRLSWNPFRLFSKRILSTFNWLFFRKDHFFEEQLFTLAPLFQNLKVDLILLGGDFSTGSLHEEFVAAQTLLKTFKKPWIAIPGNHDKYTYRSCREKRFYRYLTNHRPRITAKTDFFTLKDHGLEAHTLTSNTYLIALDTSLATNPYSSKGLISEKLQARLTELLQLLPQDAAIFLFNHYPLFQNDCSRRELTNSDQLQALIEKDPRIKLYLHGHTHRHSIADLQPNNLPLLIDSGSAAEETGSFNIIDLTPNGCAVTPYFWNKSWQSAPTREFAWTR